MIHVEKVDFRYPGATRDALHGFSLDIPAGCLFGLLGPNGSGKTTLVSLLTGLRRPTHGRLRVDAHTQVALVPQEYAFYPRLSVIENLRFFAGMHRLAGARRKHQVERVIAATGLESFTRARSQTLSGGLKRRLNLAIGLLDDPQVLLLDEPTVGIDPQSRRFILDNIRQVNAAGTTVVYTSHYMEEVEALCTRIGVLDEGRLIAGGALRDLLGQCSDTALMLGLDAAPDAALAAALQRFPALIIDGSTVSAKGLERDAFNAVLDCVRASDARITRLRYGQGNLESLFLRLTGRQLRD